MHFHPLFALFIIPALMIIALLGIPYYNYQANTAGVWFASLRGRKTALIAALTAENCLPRRMFPPPHTIANCTPLAATL